MKTSIISLTAILSLAGLISLSTVPGKSFKKKFIPSKSIAEKSKTQMLADKVWIVEEVISNVRGKNLHYRKDQFNNTGEDYSIYALTFNTDQTGAYTDGLGHVFQTKWKFATEDEHNMLLSLDSGGSYEWSMVEISDSSFQSITELNINGHDLLQSTRYVPLRSKCEEVKL